MKLETGAFPIKKDEPGLIRPRKTNIQPTYMTLKYQTHSNVNCSHCPAEDLFFEGPNLPFLELRGFRLLALSINPGVAKAIFCESNFGANPNSREYKGNTITRGPFQNARSSPDEQISFCYHPTSMLVPW